MTTKLGLDEESRNKLQRLANMMRFNNEIHLHPESVAEHSFYVTMYAMMICDSLKVPAKITNLIVKMALTHDVSEIEISDIPHNVKHMIEGLKDACDAHENKFNMKHFPRTYKVFERLAIEDQMLCREIVVLADVLSVIQYSKLEVDMGNRRFDSILEDAIERYVKIVSSFDDESRKVLSKIAKI